MGVVTGANAGMGKATAEALAKSGFSKVYVLARSTAKAENAISELQTTWCCAQGVKNTQLIPLVVDLTDLDSVVDGAAIILAENKAIDVVVNNAGIMAVPNLTLVPGGEIQWATNHIGHFVLTLLLAPALLARSRGKNNDVPTPRIVNVSSIAHYGGNPDIEALASNYSSRRNRKRMYGAWPAYSASKFANVAFTQALTRRLHAGGAQDDLWAVAVHPGVIRTGLWQHESGLAALMCCCMCKSARDGAKPSIATALDRSLKPGAFYVPTCCWVCKLGADQAAYSVAVQERIWALSVAQARSALTPAVWDTLMADNPLLGTPQDIAQTSQGGKGSKRSSKRGPGKRGNKRGKSSSRIASASTASASTASTASPSTASTASSASPSGSATSGSATSGSAYDSRDGGDGDGDGSYGSESHEGVTGDWSLSVPLWEQHASRMGYSHSQNCCDLCCLFPHMVPCFYSCC